MVERRLCNADVGSLNLPSGSNYNETFMEIKRDIEQEYSELTVIGDFNDTFSKHDLLVSKEHDRLEKQAQRIRDKTSERIKRELEAG